MFSGEQRFETQEAINAAILRLVEAGVPLDEVDVAMSQMGVVDLDLCVECLNDMALTMAAQMIADAMAVA
jgi:hypothetical protein